MNEQTKTIYQCFLKKLEDNGIVPLITAINTHAERVDFICTDDTLLGELINIAGVTPREYAPNMYRVVFL